MIIFFDLYPHCYFLNRLRSIRLKRFLLRILWWGIALPFKFDRNSWGSSYHAWIRTPVITVGVYWRAPHQNEYFLFSGVRASVPGYVGLDDYLNVQLNVGKSDDPRKFTLKEAA